MPNNRKSQGENGEKNYAKMDSYALAFRLIDVSILHNFPLEAVAIEESILSDRLWSSLHAANVPSLKHETLGAALAVWNEHQDDSILAAVLGEDLMKLKKDLTNWWDTRNKVIHGIVKAPQGQGSAITAANFEKSAMKTARDGKSLANKVKRFTQKQIRKAKKG